MDEEHGQPPAASAEWFHCGDGVRLYLHRWELPAGNRGAGPLAVLHIVHGMAEHSLRYERLARRCTEKGVEVWAADLRGHGRTADPAINDPGRGGMPGHCGDGDGFALVTGDVEAINRRIRQERPGVPLLLMGHSWGSFIVQYQAERYGNADGLILSGTRGPGGGIVAFGAGFFALIARILGPRRELAQARKAALGFCNRPFRPARTPFDWLSRDEREVDNFMADPFCFLSYSAGFCRDMLRGLKTIHHAEAMERIPRDLPAYIFAGSADPVGDMGMSPTALVNAYRSMGMEDLEFVLYPEARHEMLNETHREEVTDNLLSWILRHWGRTLLQP
ncbi:MAG: lysophospholipase [Treponema sp.]|jgi:alpha-beta hydrolase superfamily lysophospholipase|nr:lysophospholipase [Treponema sp.]